MFQANIRIAPYVTFQHTDIIMIYMYVVFPAAGVSLFILFFWLHFEALTFIRSTEAIVDMLNDVSIIVDS